MKTLNLIQDSPEWHAHRDNPAVLNASEASDMMGANGRRGKLVRQMATGIREEAGPQLQKVFDEGHRIEALARPIAEEYIGEDLSPVTGVQEVDGLTLSASFDGITFDHETTWECKQWNADKAEYMRSHDQVPTEDYWQVVQQLVVSGAKRTIYTLSDGTPERTIHVTMSLKEADQKRLIAGWKQLLEDVANYQHVEAKPEAVAAPIEALPALLVQVEGRVVATNMDAFKAKAGEFIANIKTELKTDQDFADADKMVKFLGDGEKQLVAVKQHAQAQAADIDAVFKAIDDVREQMRATRIRLEKLVAAEKDNRKAEIINGARWELQSYINKLNERIGIQMPPIQDRFAEAIKGLKSLDSMRDKVSTALANAKIEASELADRIETNRDLLRGENIHRHAPELHDVLLRNDVRDWIELFPDFTTVGMKPTDDFVALFAMRLQQYEQRLEAERERIRKEEEAKAQREAEEQRDRETPVCEIDGKPAYLGDKFFDRFGKEFTLQRNLIGGFCFGNRSTTITMQASGFLAWSQEEALAKAQQTMPPESEAGTPAGPGPSAPASVGQAVGGQIPGAEAYAVHKQQPADIKLAIDAFFARVGTPKAKQANYRAVIIAWEEFKAGADMEQAA